MKYYFIIFGAGLGLCSFLGCTTPAPSPAIQHNQEVMICLGEDMCPESFLFPSYLMMEDFELCEHGRIPGSDTLVGVDLVATIKLKEVLRRYNHMLPRHNWSVTKAEISKQTFRLKAVREDAWLEISAVQGSGSTHLLILYQKESSQTLK